MVRLTKAMVSRGLLTLGAFALLLFGLWQLPLPDLPKVANHDVEPSTGSVLPPLVPTLHTKELADQIAKRQGWASQGAVGAAQVIKKTDATKILGIGKIGQIAVVLVMGKDSVKAYRVGQTLPDGRAIKFIGSTSVRFENKAGDQSELAVDDEEAATQQTVDQGVTKPDPTVFELFPIDKTKLKPPPPIDPNASSKPG